MHFGFSKYTCVALTMNSPEPPTNTHKDSLHVPELEDGESSRAHIPQDVTRAGCFTKWFFYYFQTKEIKRGKLIDHSR